MQFQSNKILFPRNYREINEQILHGNDIIFIQNLCNGSKITIYNIRTGKIRSITMKGLLCFNSHNANNNAVFEFCSNKRGIGILPIDTLKFKEIEDIGMNDILGGIWGNHILIRRGYDIILHDINTNEELEVASSHHIFGTPVVGEGNCSWLQLYSDKYFIVLYDIETGTNLIYNPAGYINKMYLYKEYLVYQSCDKSKCCVCIYNIYNGSFKKCFESSNWIELYMGRDDVLVWTVRKKVEGKYIFDIWIYDIQDDKIKKVVADYENAVIPTVSERMILWVDANMNGDDLYLMSIDI